MALDLSDGYTLPGATESRFIDAAGRLLAEGLPVVKYRYRPASPDAKARWRYQLRVATSGEEEVTATAKLVADHLVEWDVVIDGKPAPTDALHARKVPEEIREQIVAKILSWSPKDAADAGKN